ncbi:MAG: hypothetical protein NWP83_05075, partial [Spirosomaceae bacterium]|nr:hypothetical protein [Spirosomataceae bacterium]
MHKQLSNWIYNKAHGGLVLLFLGLQTVYASVILPRFQPKNNEELLDLQFGFDKATAYRILESYGEVGRAEYLQFATVWDIIFPIIYTVSNILMVSFLVRKSFPNNLKLRLLNLLPLISLFLDSLDDVVSDDDQLSAQLDELRAEVDQLESLLADDAADERLNA